MSNELKKDALNAAGSDHALHGALKGQVIALTGGTGFLGTWIAETIAMLNDEKKLGITLHLYARHVGVWAKQRPHLGSRADIVLHQQDVRSAFDFPAEVNYVIHAAGVPDNRVHASDPLRVFETIVYGTHNVLEASTKLANLKQFINVSSGLVAQKMEAGKVHCVYADAKCAGESLGAIYRSQHRLPVSTLRPYTFIGPYQELDRPWAVNNFIRDALTAGEIRLHGDGNIRRSYLYGADAAWWALAALARSDSGKIYHLGSIEAVSHQQLAESIAARVSPAPDIKLRTMPASQQQGNDFLPDVSQSMQELGVKQTVKLDDALTRTIGWYQSQARLFYG